MCLCQCSFIPAVLCNALVLVRQAGVCIPLHFSCVCLCTCTSACFELVLVSLCSKQSSVVDMGIYPSHLLCSAILHASIVSGLSPSYPPLFPLYLLHQCDGCPSSLLRKGSWLGCKDLPAIGAVSSRSWLPIAEAPGCLGHSASI